MLETKMGAVEEVDDRLFLALGRAASALWSDLPQEFQQRLFEEAVMFQGEAFRQPLAIYLHDRHVRTTAALKAEAVPEPDSLGDEATQSAAEHASKEDGPLLPSRDRTGRVVK